MNQYDVRLQFVTTKLLRIILFVSNHTVLEADYKQCNMLSLWQCDVITLS